MGNYIYVGKFNGNNNFLHFSHLSAYKNKSGNYFCHTFPFQQYPHPNNNKNSKWQIILNFRAFSWIQL